MQLRAVAAAFISCFNLLLFLIALRRNVKSLLSKVQLENLHAASSICNINVAIVNSQVVG